MGSPPNPTLGQGVGSVRQIGPAAFGHGAAEEAIRLSVTVSTAEVRSNGAQLAEVAPLLSNGTIRAAPTARYPHERLRRMVVIT